MQGNYIGDDGLKAFGEALKLSAHIKALVLAANRMGGNNRVDCTQAFASGINDNHSLQRVDLNFNFFSAEEVRTRERTWLAGVSTPPARLSCAWTATSCRKAAPLTYFRGMTRCASFCPC
jgi:hypothetical protein